MNIIRDEEQDGMNTPCISMIPLLVAWNIERCNIKDCTENPTTIISNCQKDGERVPAFGMCENHYQEAINTEGKYKMVLDFIF